MFILLLGSSGSPTADFQGKNGLSPGQHYKTTKNALF
jgi:hypothetical protein